MDNLRSLIGNIKDMAKKITIPNTRDTLKGVLVGKIAAKRRLTKRGVYKIIAEKPDHEITIEYMTARESLVEAVKNLIPF